MEEKKHFVSVIVPVYNGASKIERCIQALLSQSYPKDRYEIIIVDNNSSDGTAAIVKELPVIYLLEDQKQTSYAARNKGITRSKGSIIAFTDGDCMVSEDWLAKGVEGFDSDAVGVVAGGIFSAEPRNYVERYLSERGTLSQEITIKHKFLPYGQTANVFFRMEVFQKIGLFESDWVGGGDAELCWRMQVETDYELKYVPESSVLHEHRSRLSSMCEQKFRWGIGATICYRKYRNHMNPRKVKETLADFLMLFRFFCQSILGFVRGFKYQRASALTFLGQSAFKLGHIWGSIRNRVYYF